MGELTGPKRTGRSPGLLDFSPSGLRMPLSVASWRHLTTTLSGATPSGQRSRMLAWRFFGGGLVAILVAGVLRLALDLLPPLKASALIFALVAALMLLSSTLFVSAGEPPAAPKKVEEEPRAGIMTFLREGLATLRRDRTFRLFLVFQWLAAKSTSSAITSAPIISDSSSTAHRSSFRRSARSLCLSSVRRQAPDSTARRRPMPVAPAIRNMIRS